MERGNGGGQPPAGIKLDLHGGERSAGDRPGAPPRRAHSGRWRPLYQRTGRGNEHVYVPRAGAALARSGLGFWPPGTAADRHGKVHRGAACGRRAQAQGRVLAASRDHLHPAEILDSGRLSRICGDRSRAWLDLFARHQDGRLRRRPRRGVRLLRHPRNRRRPDPRALPHDRGSQGIGDSQLDQRVPRTVVAGHHHGRVRYRGSDLARAVRAARLPRFDSAADAALAVRMAAAPVRRSRGPRVPAPPSNPDAT